MSNVEHPSPCRYRNGGSLDFAVQLQQFLDVQNRTELNNPVEGNDQVVVISSESENEHVEPAAKLARVVEHPLPPWNRPELQRPLSARAWADPSSGHGMVAPGPTHTRNLFVTQETTEFSFAEMLHAVKRLKPGSQYYIGITRSPYFRWHSHKEMFCGWASGVLLGDGCGFRG